MKAVMESGDRIIESQQEPQVRSWLLSAGCQGHPLPNVGLPPTAAGVVLSRRS
jgi:hypothetical protein